MAQAALTGQLDPAATTDTVLYTVAASKWVVVSGISLCNRGGAKIKVRLMKVLSGDAVANKTYYYYDLPVGANDTFQVTTGITLATGDKLYVRTDINTLAVNIDGVINDV